MNLYQELVETDPETFNLSLSKVYEKIGNVYFYMGDLEQANKYYGKSR